MHPGLTSTTNLQYATLSVAYRHNHLPNKARLKVRKFQMPKPPSCIGEQILDHFTDSSFSPPHRKSLCNFSNLFTILTGIGNRDKKYVERLDKAVLISVSLPPFDKIHFLPTHQFPSHFLNNVIPNGGRLVRRPQRNTQVFHS